MPPKRPSLFYRREIPPTAGLPGRFSDYVSRPPGRFANALAGWLDLPEPLLTCSGTAAFIVCLRAMRRLKPERDSVVVPAYTCPLVPLAVSLAGLRCLPCDTADNGFDFDPEALARLCGDRTLAVVPTHLGGRVADVPAARRAARGCGAFVIEDAAQALGARAGEHSVGLEGDAVFFSLAAGKGLSTFEGGVLCSRDPALRDESRDLAQRLLRPNWLWTARRNLELLGYTLLYRPDGLWLIYGRSLIRHLDAGDEAAAVGDVFSPDDISLHSLDPLRRRVAANALQRLPQFLEQGRQRAAVRLARLERTAGVQVIRDTPRQNGVWPFFMLRLPDQARRDRILDELWRAGLGVSRLFVRALPDYPFLKPHLHGCEQQNFTGARNMAATMLTITNSHWLDDERFERIARTVELSQ